MSDITDLIGLTDNELLARILATHTEMERAHCGFLLAVGHFELRGLAREAGSTSTAAFLVRAMDIAPSTAYEYLRVAKTLIDYSFVIKAFSEGTIGYSKVRLLSRYLTAENEYELVQLAKQLSYRELEHALMQRRPADDDGEPKGDKMQLWTDKVTGRVRFNADLSPGTGAKFLAALKVGELANFVDLTDVDPEVFGDDDKLDEVIAQAGEQEEKLPGTTMDGQEASGFGFPAHSHLLTGLIGLSNIALSTPVNKRRAPGAQVHLIHTEDGHSLLPGLPPPDPRAATAMMLNGHLRGHLLDAKGNPIQFGRTRRLVTDSQAMALLARWRFQCATPGCTHSQFMEFHHIQEWSCGGTTDTFNLMPLCSFCHSLATDGLLEIDPDLLDASKLYFRFRTGEVYVSQNRSMSVRIAPEPSMLGQPKPESLLRGIDFGTNGNDWAYFGD